nr:predicted protein [Mycena chlorophos]
MILSRVCARWRDIVLSSPRLWDDIRITVSLAPRKTPLSSECLETVVARSEPHEFKAIIGSRTPPNPREYEPYTSSLLLQLFQTPGFVERIGHFKITMSTAHYLEAIALDRHTFSSLHTLHIAPRTSHSDQSVSISDILAIFTNSPKLRHLTVFVTKGPLAPRYAGPLPSFPWAQLETIDFQCSLDARVVLWILSQTPLLVQATFTSVRCEVSIPNPCGINVAALPTEIVLPCLERLTLQGWSVIRYPVLQALVLPALKHLDLRAIKSPRAASVDLLASLQRHSGFSLASLTIADYLETQYIPSFLEANPEIRTLHVRKDDWGLFRRLRYCPGAGLGPGVSVEETSTQATAADSDLEDTDGTGASSAVLLPNLRNLTVTIRNDILLRGERLRDEGEELTRMLVSRCDDALPESQSGSGCVRLAEVNLWIDGLVMSLEAERVVQQLVEKGALRDHLMSEEPVDSTEEEEEDSDSDEDEEG